MFAFVRVSARVTSVRNRVGAHVTSVRNRVGARVTSGQPLSSNASSVPMVAQAMTHSRSRTALADEFGNDITFGQLLDRSAAVSAALRNIVSSMDMREQCVPFLTPRDASYTVAQWGIMRAGGTAVPLCTSHPGPSFLTVAQRTFAGFGEYVDAKRRC